MVLAAFLALTTWTWHSHGDVFIDTGRELYMPWRITCGDVLYRDLAHFNGPFSQYFDAACLGLFGNHVRTLECVNLAILLATVGVVHELLVRWAGRFAATIASLVQLVVFSFAQMIGYALFDWVLPYSHEITHGVALGLFALWCLVRWGEVGGRGWLLALGFASGVAFLTKPEAMLALVAALAVGVPLFARQRQEPLLRVMALVSGAALVAPLIAFVAFLAPLGVSGALRAVMGGWLHLDAPGLRELAFYRTVLGTGAPLANVLEALTWLGLAIVAFAVAAVLDRLVGARLGRMPVIAGLVTLATIVLLFVAAYAFQWDLLPAVRPLPLVLAVVVVVAFRRAWRGEPAACVVVTLGCFGLVLLAKMLLNVRVYHYGFALAMPGTLVVVAGMLRWLPGLVRRRGGSGVLVRATGLAFLAMLATETVLLTDGSLGQRSVPIGKGPDRIMADRVRGELLGQALAEFSRRLPREATLLVLPEGVTVNWFLRLRNPTGFVNFMPPELLLFGEDAMLEALTTRPPDYVLLVHKDTTEYGVPLFGTHYGRRILEFVHKRYRRAWLGGYEPLRKVQEFGIELLARQY